MRSVLAAGFALAALISSAGPLCAQQRQNQSSMTWSGGQIGGFGGTSTLGGSFVEPGARFCGSGFAAVCPEAPFSFSSGKTSATGGAFIGYSIPWGFAVLGIEADIAMKNAGISSVQADTHASPGGPTSEMFTGTLSQRWDGSVRARVGLPVNSMNMIYATGGVAFGRMSGSFVYNASIGPFPLSPACVTAFNPMLDQIVTTCGSGGGGAQSWSDTRPGYTVGVGWESVYVRNVKVRVEYRYTEFGGFSKDVPLALTAGPCIIPGCVGTGNAHIDMRVNSHTLRLGIAFGI
jgi:outer membrane immunogenic protein